MTGSELRTIRHRLGLSAQDLARVVGVSGERTVFKWEYGERGIPGPVEVLIELILKYQIVRLHLGLPATLED